MFRSIRLQTAAWQNDGVAEPEREPRLFGAEGGSLFNASGLMALLPLPPCPSDKETTVIANTIPDCTSIDAVSVL